MAAEKYDQPIAEFSQPTIMPTRTNRTWFPILFGVLIGFIIFLLLAGVESSPLYLMFWIFGAQNSKELDGMPGYDLVFDTFLFLPAFVCGCIGMTFSRWPRIKRIAYLLGTLTVIAIAEMVGNYR